MKFLCQIIATTGLLGLALTGCERHEFSETKGLHQEHSGHEKHGAEGGEHHEKANATHPEKAGHGAAVDQKGAAAPKEAPKAAPNAAPAKPEEPRATGL